MKTLYHPTLGTPVDVQDGDVEDWVEQGWRKTPTSADAAPAKRATPRRRPRKTAAPAAPAGDSPAS